MSLAHLPVTLFSSVMGLGGASLAWRRAARAWSLPDGPALLLLGVAAAAFVVTPLAAPQIGSVELAWFSFGVGMIFWVGLLPLLLQRVLLHEQQIPEKLLPTLAIFTAPTAVAMVSWGVLTGEPASPFARVLWSGALIFALLLGIQMGRLRRVPFALPYWAYAFPLAALTVATIVLAEALQAPGYDAIGAVLLALTTLLVVVVLGRTVMAATRGDLLRPE